MPDIVVDIIADTARITFEELPNKSVLYSTGLVTLNHPGISRAISRAGSAGDRIQIPRFDLDLSPWEAAKLDGSDYTGNQLSMEDAFGIVIRRRKYFAGVLVDDMRRVWGEKFEIEAGRQIALSSPEMLDGTFHKILEGAVPSSNEHSVDATISPEAIIDAEQKIGDNSQKLKFLVVHSKVWGDLRKIQFTQYANATLLNPSLISGDAVWLAGGKMVYVTDKCKRVSGSPDTFHSYLLAPGQLSFTSMRTEDPFVVTVDPKTAKNEKIGMRGDLDFVGHLNGVEYRQTSPVNPDDLQLANSANWQLGTQDAKALLAVRLITR